MNEKLKTYASTITAVFSALVVLYGVFKFVNQGNENVKSNKEIKENQQKIKVKLDSIRYIVINMEEKTDELIKSQNSLRNSYVKYIKSTVKDRDYFIELLNGIQWVVSPIEDKRDSTNFKILIKKKQ